MKGNGYDASVTLTLKGTGGLLAGEQCPVRLGETVLVGRSRHCEYSLKKTKAFLLAEDRAPILEDREFLKVSRKHLRISFLNEAMVEVENLSPNGVHVDGKRVDRLLLLDVPLKNYPVDLGGGHTFDICWGD